MSSNVKPVSKNTDVDERFGALLSNAAAIRAISSAIEGTLGPKGLNCMLVDRFGDVVVTNDGSTILDRIDAAHPAARMLIKTAKAQDDEVGDGTTTATILASALISEGVSHVARGVPVTKIIEGLRLGVERAREFIERSARKLSGPEDPLLWRTALIAGRQHKDIADLVVEAAKLIDPDKLTDPAFKLSRTVIAKEGAENQVFTGLIVDKTRANRQMPKSVENVRLLVIDGALEPEQVEDDALSTESGFARYMQLQNEFRGNVRKIADLGIKLIVAAKGIDDFAEELLTDAGVMAIRRVSSKDIERIVEHTGARTLKRSGLKKEPEELERFIGTCRRVFEDERLEHIRIEGGGGRPMATILVGASTQEVKDERERIAEDAAAAVQAALKGGVVAGGGAVEVAAAREVQRLRDSVRGMAAYGVDCVAEALRKPLMQIVANAGFNPLEKVEDVIAAQAKHPECVTVAQAKHPEPVEGCAALGIDCDTGEVADMLELGVVDPLPVKLHALRAAAEVAEAVLRINTIIRKRDDGNSPEPAG